MNDKPTKSAEDWVPVSLPIPAHWSYADFDIAFDVLPTSGIKIPESQYAASGRFPIVDQGKSFVGGYTDAEGHIINEDGAVIVFGDHTRCFKLINFPFAPGADGTKVLCPAPYLLPKFAYYGCLSLKLPNRGYSRHYSFLKKSRFPIAPIDEQRRIVAKIEELFSELDKGVESLTTAREQLKAYRQSVLKAAFEGKLTDNWRAKNADTLESPETLVARIKEEREDCYKAALDEWEAALGKWRAAGEKYRKPVKPQKPNWPEARDFDSLAELPHGWFYLPFEAVAWSVRNGISAKPDESGPLKIFRISAVRPMMFNLIDFRYITDPDGSMEEYRLNHGDLVFTRYNGSRDYVGVSAVYRGDGSHVYPDKLIRCEIKSEILNPAFLEGATNSGESRAFLERRIRTTAGQSGVSGGDIKAMPVVVCSSAEQAEIVCIVESKLQATQVMEAEIEAGLARAAALRQSILKRAFSGQLVPQDASDEPASDLLERIHAEREGTGIRKRRNNENGNKEAA